MATMTNQPTPTGKEGMPMKARIVEVAIDLFTSKGYDGTSLSQIADSLGVTKGAIYYHFHTKDEIARVIAVQALDAFVDMFDRLFIAGSDLRAWERAVAQVIDIAIVNRRFLSVMHRNEDAFGALFADDIEVRSRLDQLSTEAAKVLGHDSTDPALRVRLGCVIGAVFGPLVMLANYYEDMSPEELRNQLSTAISLLLRDV